MDNIWVINGVCSAVIIAGTIIMNWRFRRQFKNCPCKRGSK